MGQKNSKKPTSEKLIALFDNIKENTNELSFLKGDELIKIKNM